MFKLFECLTYYLYMITYFQKKVNRYFIFLFRLTSQFRENEKKKWVDFSVSQKWELATRIKNNKIYKGNAGGQKWRAR